MLHVRAFFFSSFLSFFLSEFDLWERVETRSANQASSRHLLHATLEGEDAADQPGVSEERNKTLHSESRPLRFERRPGQRRTNQTLCLRVKNELKSLFS